MASLINLHNQDVCHLLPHHTFGRREEAVDSHLDAPQVSKIHASIEWDGSHWLIKDLSRNGVWIDGNKIDSQLAIPLAEGQTIQFVSKDFRFQVAELSAPQSFLIPQDKSQGILALGDLLLLPNEESPNIAIQLCPDTHEWMLDDIHSDAEPRPLRHGDSIDCGDQHWTLHQSNKSSSPTIVVDADLSLENFLFRFHTTLDEENTSLKLANQHSKCDLGERSHHYVLLHLARCRHQDREQGLNEFDQGWIDNHLLCKEIGMDLAHINIQLYRLRKQLSDAMPDMVGVNKLVERKRGKLRFGPSSVEIYKSGQLEIQYLRSKS